MNLNLDDIMTDQVNIVNLIALGGVLLMQPLEMLRDAGDIARSLTPIFTSASVFFLMAYNATKWIQQKKQKRNDNRKR